MVATDKSSENATFGTVQARVRDGNVSAVSAVQQATTGKSGALDVRSDNGDVAAATIRGAGDLLDLKDSSGISQFTVTQTGALTSTGDQTITGNYTITGDLTVNGATVLNEGGADKDTRVEGDTEVNLVFVDASTDRVGVGTATPGQRFSVVGGNISIATAGNGLMVAEGSNAKMGTAALTAGAATVSTTAVTANSRIFLTSNTDGGTPGFVRVSARVAGTSFTITSSSGTDTSTIAWMLVDPAA